MPENREIPAAPLHGGEGRPVKVCGRTTGMYAAGKSDRPVVPGKLANNTTCDGRGGVGGGKGFGQGEDESTRNISNAVSSAALRRPWALPGLISLREAFRRRTMDGILRNASTLTPKVGAV